MAQNGRPGRPALDELPAGVITGHGIKKKVVVEVMRRMSDKDLRRIYVVDGGKIIGRIARWDSMRNLLDAIMSLGGPASCRVTFVARWSHWRPA